MGSTTCSSAKQWLESTKPSNDKVVNAFEVNTVPGQQRQNGPWEGVHCIVDSGACNHVGPPELGKDFPLQETNASRDGQCFMGADGSKMRNLGCKDIFATTDFGEQLGARVQIAEKVKRTLLSVGKLVDSGNSVVFNSENSYIYNKASGESTPIYRENGVYKMNLWIPRNQYDPFSTVTGKTIMSTTDDKENDEFTMDHEEHTNEECGECQDNSVFHRRLAKRV